MTLLNHPCMICGTCESTLTVMRKWLDTYVYSDECLECNVYLNEHTNSLLNNVSIINAYKQRVRFHDITPNE